MDLPTSPVTGQPLPSPRHFAKTQHELPKSPFSNTANSLAVLCFSDQVI